MATQIKDLSPSMSIASMESELYVASSFQDQTAQLVGGLTAGSRELTQGNIHIQGVDERILVGENVDAFMHGVGVYIGKDPDDGLYKFRAGDPAGVNINWDGVSLNIYGYLPEGSAANDVNTNVTTINGGKITANTITATQLITTQALITATAQIGTAVIASASIISLEASKITSQIIDAQIASIAFAKITSVSITNAMIVSLNADKITAGTLSADRIAATSITASKLNISTLSSISADIGTITSGTITGAVLQTATSGSRVKISGVDNSIRFYNGGGNLCGEVYGASGASGSLVIDGAYSLYVNVTAFFTDWIRPSASSTLTICNIGDTLDNYGNLLVGGWGSFGGDVDMNGNDVNEIRYLKFNAASNSTTAGRIWYYNAGGGNYYFRSRNGAWDGQFDQTAF